MSRFSKKLSGEEKTVAKNYGALVVLQGLNYLLPLLIIPFLEHQLGLEKFGLVMFAQSLMVFFVLITDFGFSITATREIAILKTENKDYSEVYFKVFWARIVLVIFCFLLLLILVFSFDKFRINWQLYLLSYGLVVGHAIFPVWFFQGIEKMRFITVVNVVAKVIFTVLLFLFISSPDDYLNVPIFNSIGFIIAGLLSFLISLKSVTWRKPNFISGKAFYKESLNMFVSNLSSSLYTSFNAFLLGIFGGDILVGIYTPFEKLILAAKNMYIPIYQAIFPYMARKPIEEMRSMMKKLFMAVTALGILICAIFTILGEWILGLLFKDPLIVENVDLFKIMSLIALFSGINMLFNVLYFPATKQFKKLMKIMVVAGVFNAVLSLIIVPIFKLEGTIAAVVSTEFLLLIIALFLYRKEINNTKPTIVQT
ncbi:MAG: oligosaccharide flippase family protein [Nonlabens sp.]|uniref:oligosaccharide flippase family protein n=2 Tax=Nonlabens sp. TaxID=1888209 RepID=UPI0032193F43